LKCKNPNESLNSHWLPANVAGRLTVLPANRKIHPHLAGGRVLISGPVYDTNVHCLEVAYKVYLLKEFFTNDSFCTFF